jgi:D-alanyl-D-alanine dipeptidase
MDLKILPIIFILSTSFSQCNMVEKNILDNSSNKLNSTGNISEQLILVTTPNWTSYKAKINIYEKDGINWKKVKGDIKAVIGKNGMGWGKGIYNPEDAINNTFRKEGDKRTPAGIFTISTVFGLNKVLEAKKELNIKYPYIELTENTRCIGESKSKFYNEIVEQDKISKDWENDKNNELMRYEAIRDEQAYKWGLFIDHNSNINNIMKKDNTSGSCIFMHLWKNEETPTAGCTAIEESEIKNIISWLDYSKKPIIVQLPEPEYKRLKNKWNLP